MKVVVTFDIDEKNLYDLVVMAKVYRKKDGYKEFVSVENNLPLRPLPNKCDDVIEIYNAHGEIDCYQLTEYARGYNDCLEELEK